MLDFIAFALIAFAVFMVFSICLMGLINLIFGALRWATTPKDRLERQHPPQVL